MRTGGILGASGSRITSDGFTDANFIGYTQYLGPRVPASAANGSISTTLDTDISTASMTTTAGPATQTVYIETLGLFTPPLLLTCDILGFHLTTTDTDRFYVGLFAADGDYASIVFKAGPNGEPGLPDYAGFVGLALSDGGYTQETWAAAAFSNLFEASLRVRLLWTESGIEVSSQTWGDGWDTGTIRAVQEYALPAMKPYHLRIAAQKVNASEAGAVHIECEDLSIREFARPLLIAPRKTGEALASAIH